MAWKSSFRQNYRTTFSPTVPTSAAGISHVVTDVEAPGGEKWEHLTSGGKQWQATPKNLPSMQRTRAMPVTRLNSGLCPDRPKGWIPIIIIQFTAQGEQCQSLLQRQISQCCKRRWTDGPHWHSIWNNPTKQKKLKCAFCKYIYIYTVVRLYRSWYV